MTVLETTVSAALTRVELHESELLSWGIVDSALTEVEFEELLRVDLPPGVRIEAVKSELLDRLLVVRTPHGAYRSRMAETLRLLSKIRQQFPQQHWWEGTPLVLDYRFIHRARRRPLRDRARADALVRLAPHFSSAGRQALTAIAPPLLSGFQERTSVAIAEAIAANRDSGVMVTAGTGSGKTLAFYMPALGWIADSVAADESLAVRGLALYPRGELLKDQFRTVLQLTRQIANSASTRPIRVGTWFGPTPRAAYWMKQGWANGWDPVKSGGATVGWVCPYLMCLVCRGAMIWKAADLEHGNESLTCADQRCGDVVDERFITLTRDRAAASPADLMFTTTESLNRQLAAPDQLRAFGVRGPRARLVLLDEVHTYEGASGAQNALLARRLRHAIGRPLVWVGLSATLRNAESFLGQFTGLYGDRITVTQADPEELEEAGAEYLVALRHDPSSGTGPLSTTIQTSMLLARCLDASGTPYDPAPSSNGTFGKKAFVFTDKLDVTNRLYWDLLDAEGWWQRGKPKSRPVLTLAHLRAEQQTRRAIAQRETANDREAAGQWWWLAEQLGRDLSGDEQLDVGRTSSQDVGVEAMAEVIVATATLEVGYDDPDVGAVIQHKAPHDEARFVQRKGRAGRDPAMRPWTVVVLSDWGRDRVAWELYDQLFDPELDPRHLPLRNRYVLRMQAVYSTLDWLAGRLDSLGQNRSTWVDTVAPAETLESSPERVRARAARQRAMAELIAEVLSGGPAREHLRSHLRRALGFADDEQGWQEIDALLWASPRPLLLAVLPTVHRRLRSQWAGEVPDRQSNEVRTRTPLREFIAGNLFDDLLTPEVEILVPTGARDAAYEPKLLPAMRMLRELMPGNVTRHFGVSSFSRRHWVPLVFDDGTASIDVVSTYRAEFVTEIISAALPAGGVALYRPTGVTLGVPPTQVRDATSVAPSWMVQAEPLGDGRDVALGRDRWQRVLRRIRVHAHAAGDGARYRRFALGARGTYFGGGAPQPVSISFTSSNLGDQVVGLGIELDVDAVRLDVEIPTPPRAPSPLERSDRLTFVLTQDPNLPDELNWFQRSALTSAILVVLSELQPSPTWSALKDVTDVELTVRLIDALQRLGSLSAVDPDAADADRPGIEPEAAPPEEDHGLLERWCRDQRVLTSLRLASQVAWAERDADWLIWWRRRFASTLGAVFLEAVGRAAPDVDVNDLTIDIDPQGVANAASSIVEVWISELAPGGNGQVEQIHRVMLDDPRRFIRILDVVLDDSEYERLDRDVRSFLALEELDSRVRDHCDATRSAWPQGHAAVASAFAGLRSATDDASEEFGRTAWTTIMNRMLGPGASSDMPATVKRLLERWDSVEESLSLEVPPRVFGALCSNDPSLDSAFRLGQGASAYRRSRVVGGFFWPRGGAAARIELDSGNSFGLLPLTDQSMLREALGSGPVIVEVDEWDEEVERLMHRTLIDDGQVVLRFTSGGPRAARAAILRSQLEPVDLGALLAYPRVIGLWRRQGAVHVTLVLDEATQ